MKKENQISPKIISLSFAVIVMLFVTAFYIFAWTEPTTTPPGGNVAVPINTSSDSQYKTGKLGASTTGVDANYGLTIGSNGIKVTGNSYFEGNVTVASGNDIVFAGELMPDGATCANNQILQKIGADNWDCVNMPSGGTLSGSGTINYISKWTAGTALGNSQIFDNNTNVGIGTATPGKKLDIAGAVRIRDANLSFYNTAGSVDRFNMGISGGGGFQFMSSDAVTPRYFYIVSSGGSAKMTVNFETGDITNTGTLTVSGAGNSSFAGNVDIGTATPGAKLEVAGQIKITGGTPGANKVLTSDATGLATWQTPTGGISGSGTANYIPVWTGGTALGNSPFIINTGSTSPAPYIDFANYKLRNVREIDPIFNINGKKYTSYLPDSIGQKIEVVGQAKLTGNSLEIDLAKEPEGSDLWLFWQTAYRESIVPFVSAQDNASLYAFIDGSKFIIKLTQGQKDAKFSYRLIATRLDHAGDENNLYSDQTVESFIDIDSLRK
jgi:hypothetical protein